MRDRALLLQLFLIGTVAALVGVGLALLIDWFPDQAAAEAPQIDTLFDVLLAVSIPIFVLVMTVAIYSVVKFRARPGDERDGPPLHGNARLEIIWVTVPFLIVTALAIYAWVVLIDIEEPQPDRLLVDVTGEQFTWSFAYPPEEEGGQPVRTTEAMLPLDRQVEFRIRTQDVIHSFWVPAFRLKEDTVPGITTQILVTPIEEGTFDVACAELCGLGHSTMRQSVTVVPEDEFTAWLDEQEAALAEAEADAAAAEGQSPSGLAGQAAEEESPPPAGGGEDEPAAGQDAGGGDGPGGGAEGTPGDTDARGEGPDGSREGASA